MSFISDYFNHKAAVQRRLDQLDALNFVIKERTNKAYQIEDYISDLEYRISQITSLYPDLLEDEAIKEYFASLKQQDADLSEDITSKKKELEVILLKLQIAENITEMRQTKDSLAKELAALQKYKSKIIKTEVVMLI